MVIYNKEMKNGFKGLAIWTGAITFMMLICVFLYPEMEEQMGGLNKMFANMGAFTKAFGMEQLNFGTLIGFYGVECGNILGLGGGLFAAYLGITMLSKEEKDHTVEFLLSHPIKRGSVLTQKILAVVSQILIMNLIVFAAGILGTVAIGEELPLKEMLLIHAAYLILQLEIGLVCFGISAILRRASIGIGLGGAAILYFMNIIKNISEEAAFLKYITPFAYAEPAEIISNESLDMGLIAIGVAYMAVFLFAGIFYYNKKDISV